MKRRTFISAIAASALAFTAMPASAQEVTLRLHQFLPPVATVPTKILKPWGERLAQQSDGRIKIEHFDAMSLGGRPAELFDQARDGVADITMTLTGYTPGRFPRSEVFELPFIMKDSVATSSAYWDLVEKDFQNNEFKDVKVLAAFVHGPGLIHSKDPINSLEDMKAKTMRGPTRIINDLLGELGATPVGMPLPAIPEALSKGVINGTVIPWEVTPSIRLTELVQNHTTFAGDEALYTATIVIVMNKDKYNSLPDDLKAILDAESGPNLTKFAAEMMKQGDEPGEAIAIKANNNIIKLDEAETERWKAAAKPVIDRWVTQMNDNSIDGAALIEEANSLIDKHSM